MRVPLSHYTESIIDLNDFQTLSPTLCNNITVLNIHIKIPIYHGVSIKVPYKNMSVYLYVTKTFCSQLHTRKIK